MTVEARIARCTDIADDEECDDDDSDNDGNDDNDNDGDEYCDDDDINDDGYDDSFVTMPTSQSGTCTSLVQRDEPG